MQWNKQKIQNKRNAEEWNLDYTNKEKTATTQYENL